MTDTHPVFERASLEIVLEHTLLDGGGCSCGQWKGDRQGYPSHLGAFVISASRRTLAKAASMAPFRRSRID